jgi:D-inositol-3-phosphate glycosyltransferase
VKIALVSEHASPLAVIGDDDAGGQNVHVAELARALGRLDIEVVVHTRRADPSLPRRVPFAPNVVIDHVPAGPAVPLAKDRLLPLMGEFARNLVVSWQRDRPDVVHSHFWMSGIAAVRAGRCLNIPVLHTYHALGIEKRRHQGAADTSPPERVAAEAHLARSADRLVATTHAEAAALAAMGAAPTNIEVVPCGVDLTRFRPADARATRSTSAPARVVTASRLVPRKGVADLIAALPSVPGAELVVAGGAPGAFVLADEEGARLHRLAVRLGVVDRVTFLGAVPRDAMPDLLRSADLVACCPWYEPFGLVAVEAMACGAAVLATAVGGLAETVVDGTTGVHVRPRDPASIAAGLRHLLDDEERRSRMGEAAGRRATAYGWDDIARRTAAIAQRTVAAGREREVAS